MSSRSSRGRKLRTGRLICFFTTLVCIGLIALMLLQPRSSIAGLSQRCSHRYFSKHCVSKVLLQSCKQVWIPVEPCSPVRARCSGLLCFGFVQPGIAYLRVTLLVAVWVTHPWTWSRLSADFDSHPQQIQCNPTCLLSSQWSQCQMNSLLKIGRLSSLICTSLSSPVRLAQPRLLYKCAAARVCRPGFHLSNAAVLGLCISQTCSHWPCARQS